MPSFTQAVEAVGLIIDAAGVAVILIGLVYAVYRLARVPRAGTERYRELRSNLGRGILLGLEFLVAADIIRTVAIAPTLRSVAVLGGIVLIRTFLSIAIDVELEGRWPWRRADRAENRAR